MTENKVLRQSNIELLRIVLMCMIITHHLLVHNGLLRDISQVEFKPQAYTWLQIILNSFVVVAVNTFIFISGYFSIHFNIKTLVQLLLQAIFYAIIIYIGACFVLNQEFEAINFIKSFIPVARGTWWFLTIFIGLYFMAPILNAGIDALTPKQFRIILVGLLYLNCVSGFIFEYHLSGTGYSIFNFITIYILARYLKKYPIVFNPYWLYFSCTFTIAILGLLFLKLEKFPLVWKLYSYNNPILILSATALFFCFYQWNIQWNLINKMATYTFGIYLIHDHEITRTFLEKNITLINSAPNTVYYFMYLLLIIVTIFMICCFIDYLRFLLVEPINKKLHFIIHHYLIQF